MFIELFLVMSKNINNIHDKFLKSALADKELAQEFLQHFLPDNIVPILDIPALKPQDYSYISSELNATFSDIIFTIPLKETSGKHCQVSLLLEHKSKKDPNTAFQLLHYIASGYLKQLKNKEHLSPIIPIVYYHGKQPWEYKSVYDHFEKISEDVKPFIPDFATHFIDLVRMSDEELLQLKGTFIISVILSQKYSHQPKELIQNLGRIFHTFSSEKKNFQEALFVYIMKQADIKEEKIVELLEDAPSDIKNNIMTTYDQIISKGKQLGVEESKVNTILNGYNKGHSEELIADFYRNSC